MLLSVKCLLTLFISEICYYYFLVIIDFSNREMYSAGQLIYPKDRESCVLIRLYAFYFIYGVFLWVWKCLAASYTCDCTFLKFFMATNFLLKEKRLWTKSFDSGGTNPDLSNSSLTSGVRCLNDHRPWLYCCCDNLPLHKIPPLFW